MIGVHVLIIFFVPTDSLRVLPAMYNAAFEKREKKSRELLLDMLESSPRSKRK